MVALAKTWQNILITGDKGFVGTHLMGNRFGLDFEYHYLGWDIKDKKDIFSNRFEEQVRWADAVIHLAAETSVTGSFNNPQDYYRVNVLGTARVVRLCQKYGKKLIFPSTGAYYNRELSPYAESKALAEDIVTKFPRTTVLRLFNVYGTNMNSSTGSIIYNFAQAAVNDKPITIYGSGDQTRDFISVKDVVEIIKAAISPKWDNKIVDVGTGEAYTINYVAELFEHFRKKPNFELSYHEAPKREIKWSIANTQMLKSLYKKKLKTNLEKDIEEIVRFYDTN